MQRIRAVEWSGDVDGYLRLLDQTRLPREVRFIECRTPREVWDAIRNMQVRGAPALGIAAAMGAYLGARESKAIDAPGLIGDLRRVAEYLEGARPTAVNLSWALRRMVRTAEENAHLPVAELKRRLLDEALAIHDEDARMCRAIAEHGEPLLRNGEGILTHCNAGALATAEYGTALAPILLAHERGKHLHVYADETRPLLQGARLTAWELAQAGVQVTLITDNMAGLVMREGRVQRVIVGADRIAANGDTANKVGTYSLAVLAHAHGIPFYVAAPSSTFDLSLPDGSGIPIEERSPDEITMWFGQRIAPDGISVYNPAFDVTPARYITAIITDRGIIESPDTAKIARHLLATKGA